MTLVGDQSDDFSVGLVIGFILGKKVKNLGGSHRIIFPILPFKLLWQFSLSTINEMSHKALKNFTETWLSISHSTKFWQYFPCRIIDLGVILNGWEVKVVTYIPHVKL